MHTNTHICMCSKPFSACALCPSPFANLNPPLFVIILSINLDYILLLSNSNSNSNSDSYSLNLSDSHSLRGNHFLYRE